MAKAIFSEWFCKFGIPAQVQTDNWKEFVNKLSIELFDLRNVEHIKMTLAHPQCNAQVEFFNKTVKKYLASFLDETTSDWENFLPALMLSYNTSYHSTIATTPFTFWYQNTIKLDDMYQVATKTQRVTGSKTTQPVPAVNEDSHPEPKDDEDEIAAFQNRWNTRFQNKSKKPNSVATQCSNH